MVTALHSLEINKKQNVFLCIVVICPHCTEFKAFQPLCLLVYIFLEAASRLFIQEDV